MESRQVFNRQPARAVILDLQAPMDMSTCVNIQQALSDILLTLAHMAGPIRVPLLSLSVLHSYTECLFSLQPIKGNLPRLQGALSELRSFAGELNFGRRHIRSSLLGGIQEALTQFQRISSSVKQDSGQSSRIMQNFPSQIEVVIFTAQDSQSVRKSIERVIGQIELENLKKIHVVSIIDPEKLIEEDLIEEISLSQNLSQLDIPESPTELSLSILDVTTCNNDIASLQNFYKNWFADCTTDSEHIQLTLPQVGSLGQPLILKCDMHERMLDLSLFPSFTKNLFLHMGGASLVNSSGRGLGPTAAPVYKLKGVRTVSCNGVCESVLFGTPYIINATYCWKLDWEELENNQLHFQALCHYLRDMDQALLVSTDINGLSSNSPPQVIAHYLLMPSPFSSSLLLKSIVSNEFLLPVEIVGSDEEQQLPNSESMDLIGECLSKLKHDDIYNPLDVHSHLFHVISSTTPGRSKLDKPSVDYQRGKGRGAGLAKRKTIGGSGSQVYSTLQPSNEHGNGRGIKKFRAAAKNDFVYGGESR